MAQTLAINPNLAHRCHEPLPYIQHNTMPKARHLETLQPCSLLDFLDTPNLPSPRSERPEGLAVIRRYAQPNARRYFNSGCLMYSITTSWSFWKGTRFRVHGLGLQGALPGFCAGLLPLCSAESSVFHSGFGRPNQGPENLDPDPVNPSL